jgi:TolB protein
MALEFEEFATATVGAPGRGVRARARGPSGRSGTGSVASSRARGGPARGQRAPRPRAWTPTAVLALALAFLGTLAAPRPAAAQDPDQDLPEGVQLKLVYETRYRDRLAIQPFTGRETDPAVEEVHRIVQRDLDYSDRFEMMFTIPERLQQGPLDYAALNSLGIVYLLTGSIEPMDGGGYGLRLALHDVVYGSVREIRHFALPAMDDAGFRMAVHAASDEVVRWATGEPGIAATRIALTRLNRDGRHELLMVDSDGENLRSLHVEESIYSPTWSPDGSRIAYGETNYVDSDRIIEREIDTGRTRTLTERGLPAQTPAYAPGGDRLAMGLWIDGGMEIHDFDVRQYCCLRRLSRNSRIDMHPSYSSDGRRLVFQSDRLGNPHIFVMPADGGSATLITPFETGASSFYFGPEWSPTSSQVVFSGRSRGVNQVMYANADRPGGPVQQITAEGRSEDPSWAPDGRHIVFSGVRNDGMGLYVIDLVTGRIRPLVTGGRYRMPDWSPVLEAATSPTVAP